MNLKPSFGNWDGNILLNKKKSFINARKLLTINLKGVSLILIKFLKMGAKHFMIDINFLKETINCYIKDDNQIEMILRAYFYAENLHKGQKRQSGEEYIIHPLSVAFILAEMYADADTICAALLHDTLEDTDCTKKDIASEFNETVADLVDGVTKISKMNFSSKHDEVATNTRKVINGVNKDIRIVIIKLADRLHNMRTLEHKVEFKQIENALETMEIYVPLAYYLGIYQIKNELEDLSLKYLKPDIYKEIKMQLDQFQSEAEVPLYLMLDNVSTLLSCEGVAHSLKIRTKNIYGIYKSLVDSRKICDIHDLLSLKVQVESIRDCYTTLGIIHTNYHPLIQYFRDYIAMPKTNFYKSIHTTVFGVDDRLFQLQIRTHQMDQTNTYGITTYWQNSMINANARVMQAALTTNFQFARSLTELNNLLGSDVEFLEQIKKELLTENIYVYTPRGDVIELPSGSTVIDFAYRIHTDLGNQMIASYVNDELVEPGYVLKNQERVRIVASKSSDGPEDDWLRVVRTTQARKRIREFKNRIGEPDGM